MPPAAGHTCPGTQITTQPVPNFMPFAYVTTAAQAQAYVADLVTCPVLGVDIETTGLDPYRSRVRLLSVAAADGRCAVFDLATVPVEALQALSQVPWIAFNAQFEWRHLTQAGFRMPQVLHDAMLLDRLLSHRLRPLDAVAFDVLGLKLDKTLQRSDWAGELSRAQLEYAATDALAAVHIGIELLPMVESRQQGRLYRLWHDAAAVLASLSLRGQQIDWDAHSALRTAWAAEQEQLRVALKSALVGINLNSSPQLGEWLAQHLPSSRIEIWPRTDTGRLKTDAEALALSADLPGVQQLLRYKTVTKLLGTYGTGYARHRNPVTGRLHPDFSIGFTLTGRIAASKPNTQNPPRQAAIRQLFVPSAGRRMIGADFSQIELRVAALLSRDRDMIRAYSRQQDLHRLTAAAIAGIAPDAVTKEQRQAAKAVNFGNLYGQGAKGLARTAWNSYGATMTEQEARHALRRFDAAYPSLAAWKRQQVRMANERRQVCTVRGLIRDFDAQGTGYLAGEAVNVPVQGSAAEIMLETLTRLPAALRPSGATLSHNVHDELVIEADAGCADRAAAALAESMRAGMLAVFPEAERLGLAGPDLVEVKQGHNWAEVH